MGGNIRPPRRGAGRLFSALVAAAVVTATMALIAPSTPAAAAGGCTAEFGVAERDPEFPEYYFRRCLVPDFDQIRKGFEDDGKMYCGPTAGINWMVYLAERGAASVMPGPGQAENYSRIDQAIVKGQ